MLDQPPFVAPSWFKIRDYQELAIKAILDNFKRKESALLCLPTGTGKTKTFIELLRRLYAKNPTRRFLVLVPFEELKDQTLQDALDFGLSPHNLVCETNAYFMRHFLEYDSKEFFVVVQDEAHHSKAQGFERTLKHFRTPYKLGCSATPERLDGLPLVDLYTNLVQPYNVQWYEDQGHLAEVEILSKDLSDLTLSGSDDDLEYQESMLDNVSITGDVIEHYREHLYGIPTLGFATSVTHSENVASKFNEAFSKDFTGTFAVHLDANTPKGVRRTALREFKEGLIKQLWNVQLFVEGVDIVGAKGLIWLRKTQSPIIWNQAIGRIRRPTKDGSKGIVLDHVGNYITHGHPNFSKQYTLLGKNKNKDKNSTPLLPVEVPTHCSKCNEALILFARDLRCLVCGASFKLPKKTKEKGLRELTTVDGQLVKYTLHPANKSVSDLITKWKRTQSTDKPYAMGWMYYRLLEVLKEYPDLPDDLIVLALKAVKYTDQVALFMCEKIKKEGVL